MKKILTLLVCTVLIFSSCNKNKKFNKTLDGTWISTTIDGQAVSADDASKMTFSKGGKDDGKVTLVSYTDGVQDDEVITGTYKITDKGNTLTIDATGTVAGTGTSNPGYSYTYKSVGTISDDTKTKFKVTETITGSVTTGGISFPIAETQVVEYSKQ